MTSSSSYSNVLEPLGGEDTLRAMLGVEEFYYTEKYDALLVNKYYTCGFIFRGRKIFVTKGLTKTGWVYYRVWDLERHSGVFRPTEVRDAFECFVGCSLL